jgi:hypothetical protein
MRVGRLYPEACADSGTGFGFRTLPPAAPREEAYFLAKRLGRIAPRGRLLEVGCALGFLIEALQRFSAGKFPESTFLPFAVEFARHRLRLERAVPDARGRRLSRQSFDFIVRGA